MFAKDVRVQNLITPAVLAADNTPVAVDLIDGRDATILLSVGVGGITFTDTNKIEFVLTHSDDGVTYENVTAKEIADAVEINDGVIKSLTAEHAAATVDAFRYIGYKRYLKLLAKFSGTHGTGTGVSAVFVQADLYKAPRD